MKVYFHGGIWFGRKARNVFTSSDSKKRSLMAVMVRVMDSCWIILCIRMSLLCRMMERLPKADSDAICKPELMRVNGPRNRPPDSWLNGGKVSVTSLFALTLGALYENEYIKENGIWKLKTLKYRPQWHATFEKGRTLITKVNLRLGSYSSVWTWLYRADFRNFIPFVSTKYPEGLITIRSG